MACFSVIAGTVVVITCSTSHAGITATAVKIAQRLVDATAVTGYDDLERAFALDAYPIPAQPPSIDWKRWKTELRERIRRNYPPETPAPRPSVALNIGLTMRRMWAPIGMARARA